jgi:hypothetical protein
LLKVSFNACCGSSLEELEPPQAATNADTRIAITIAAMGVLSRVKSLPPWFDEDGRVAAAS